MTEKSLSRSMEDYLRVIRTLEHSSTAVRSVDVARELTVARPTVHMALRRLKEAGLLRQDHYSTIVLTGEGKRISDLILEKRNLASSILKGNLGIEGEAADEEICRLEHDLSLDTLRKLDEIVSKNGSGFTSGALPSVQREGHPREAAAQT